MKTRRLWMLLMALLACGLIAAGCGDDDDDEAQDDSPAAAETTADESAAEEPATEEEPADGGGEVDADDPAVQQAIDSCKQTIEGNPQLSDDVKSDLLELCEKAAEGDAEQVKQATRDVCVKIVEETAPEGPARDQALEACEQATQ